MSRISKKVVVSVLRPVLVWPLWIDLHSTVIPIRGETPRLLKLRSFIAAHKPPHFYKVLATGGELQRMAEQ